MKSNELVDLLSFKADKRDISSSLKKKVSKKEIQRVIEIMHLFQKQIKHLIIVTGEKVWKSFNTLGSERFTNRHCNR